MAPLSSEPFLPHQFLEPKTDSGGVAHQGRRAGKGVGGRDAVSPNLVGTLFWEKAFYSPMKHLHVRHVRSLHRRPSHDFTYRCTALEPG